MNNEQPKSQRPTEWVWRRPLTDDGGIIDILPTDELAERLVHERLLPNILGWGGHGIDMLIANCLENTPIMQYDAASTDWHQPGLDAFDALLAAVASRYLAFRQAHPGEPLFKFQTEPLNNDAKRKAREHYAECRFADWPEHAKRLGIELD